MFLSIFGIPEIMIFVTTINLNLNSRQNFPVYVTNSCDFCCCKITLSSIHVMHSRCLHVPGGHWNANSGVHGIILQQAQSHEFVTWGLTFKNASIIFSRTSLGRACERVRRNRRRRSIRLIARIRQQQQQQQQLMTMKIETVRRFH